MAAHATITRRSFIRHSAAALSATGAATAAFAASDATSPLHELIADWRLKQAEYLALNAEMVRMQNRHEPAEPIVRWGARKRPNAATGELETIGHWEARYAFEVDRHFADMPDYMAPRGLAARDAERDRVKAKLARLWDEHEAQMVERGVRSAEVAEGSAYDAAAWAWDAIVDYRPRTFGEHEARIVVMGELLVGGKVDLDLLARPTLLRFFGVSENADPVAINGGREGWARRWR